MEDIKRIPRPLNSTHLARVYREERTVENLKKLRYCILKAFVNNQYYEVEVIMPNLYLKPTKPTPSAPHKNNSKQEPNKPETKDRGIYTNAPNKNQVTVRQLVPGTLQGIARFLSMREDKVRQRLMVLLKNNAKATMSEEMEQDAIGNMARVCILGTLFKAQQQGLIQAEWGTELRTIARLNGYHPLQVKEANSAMANEAQLSNQVFNMAIKMAQGLKPTTGTQINIQQNNTPTTQNQYLTPTMAISLIEEKGYNALPAAGTQLLEQLALEHNISAMPDVKAIGADAQGIVAPKAQDLAYLDHESRREAEIGVIDHQID